MDYRYSRRFVVAHWLCNLIHSLTRYTIVDFDIDNGPCIKELYPPVALDPTLQENMCALA